MKFSAAFVVVAVALAASSAEAIPLRAGLSSVGGKISSGASSVGSGISSGASKIGKGYDGNAAGINAGLAGTAGILGIAGTGIAAQTNEDKNNQEQQPQRRLFKGSKGSSGSSYTPSTPGLNVAKPGASGADKINTGVGALAIGNSGLALWNAQQGANQQDQAEQQPQRRLNPAVAAEGALMAAPMLMGGGSMGPSFQSTHVDQSGQKSGNANVRVGGKSGRRALDRRLLSFSDTNSDGSAQYSGNANVRVGASSGGPDPARNAIVNSLLSGGQQKPAQKQQKRLLSFGSTHEDGSAQQSGNQNVRIGASSGNVSPEVVKMLNPGTGF